MQRTLDFRDHRRSLRDNRYIYAVVSRRAGGLSIGVNLNPDKVCNFDCPYCQVDRTTPGGAAKIDLSVLTLEIDHLLDEVTGGGLWGAAPFDTVAAPLRRLADIAFAGDGEPTSPPAFAEAAAIVRESRDRRGLSSVPLRLLTNATFLHRPRVVSGLPHFDDLWCKLDAGTPEWFAKVDGTAFPFTRILNNLRLTALARPITLQSMFVAIGDEAPDDAEVQAWVGRIADLRAAGGEIAAVQVYTLARAPADTTVRALPPERLQEIAAAAAALGVKVEVWA